MSPRPSTLLVTTITSSQCLLHQDQVDTFESIFLDRLILHIEISSETPDQALFCPEISEKWPHPLGKRCLLTPVIVGLNKLQATIVDGLSSVCVSSNMSPTIADGTVHLIAFHYKK